MGLIKEELKIELERLTEQSNQIAHLNQIANRKYIDLKFEKYKNDLEDLELFDHIYSYDTRREFEKEKGYIDFQIKEKKLTKITYTIKSIANKTLISIAVHNDGYSIDKTSYPLQLINGEKRSYEIDYNKHSETEYQKHKYEIDQFFELVDTWIKDHLPDLEDHYKKRIVQAKARIDDINKDYE